MFIYVTKTRLKSPTPLASHYHTLNPIFF
ncbi:hypothetical protein KSS87_010881 [Heliosperma pusillum]|nr:hypothetical protein KSS87_010881 [Heliosperma pusillum]